MLGSVAFRSPPLQLWPASALEAAGADLSSRASRPLPPSPPRSTVVCAALREYPSYPKRSDFGNSPLERLKRQKSFLEKTEDDLTDYCTTLQGDDCYYCWMAYFKLKDLEQELPKEAVEELVIQSGGNKSLIKTLNRIAAMEKKKKEKEMQQHKPAKESQPPKPVTSGTQRETLDHVPDGLPPTQEELKQLQEEERARMSEDLFTRLYRNQARLSTRYLGDH